MPWAGLAALSENAPCWPPRGLSGLFHHNCGLEDLGGPVTQPWGAEILVFKLFGAGGGFSNFKTNALHLENIKK